MKPDTLERKYAARAIGEMTADGTFTGYASLFGVNDLGRDRVEKGAFAASLAKRSPAGIRMLYQHDPAQPIGRWLEIREDGTGLRVKGRIAQNAARSREVLELMRDGALDGLSIGFRTIRARTEPGTGIRRILEADLWEISVVTFPMLPGARIETVKGLGPIPTKRQMEHWLTREAGLTRGQARAFIAKGHAGLSRGRDAANPSYQRLPELIRQATQLFR